MCNCEENKIINLNMGCCVPIVANADAYYTKSEIDEKIDEIVTSGCCITPEEVDDKISAATEGYATEQWVEDKHYITGVDLSDYALKSDIPTSNSAFTNDMGYLTEHQHLKTINGETLVGDGNIDISGTTIDLSDYFTKEETNELLDYKLDESAYTPTDLSDYYTKQQVDAKIPSLSGYVTNTEFIQYIENLQNQITSLQEVVSGCCGGGSGYTRWITMTGDNDFVCSGTTKYTKEKEQTSVNGIDWVDTGNYRIGDSILEYNSVDCGYVPPCVTLTAYTSGGTVLTPSHTEQINGNLSWNSTKQGNMAINSTAITAVNISNCVTYIESETFAPSSTEINYVNLEYVEIPSSVTRIGHQAFKTRTLDMCELKTVICHATTPPTMSNDYEYFSTEGGLTIYVPSESVDTYKAANGWSRYASIIQPIFNGKWIATYSDSSTTTASCDSTSAITNNEITKANLISVKVGDCVKTIGNGVFEYCSGLTSCTIGSGVTSIDTWAFAYCSGLTSVDIPDSVTSIGNYAFEYCSSFTNIDIPNSVTSIGDYVFAYCTSLTSITIGSGVTSIGDTVFFSCSGLASVTINATTPPTLGSNVFLGASNNMVIYVPSESVDTYKAASGWPTYASRIQPIT